MRSILRKENDRELLRSKNITPSLVAGMHHATQPRITALGPNRLQFSVQPFTTVRFRGT